MQALIIGIAGGSGSGKTTVAHMIEENVGKDRITFIQMDSYYRDLSHIPLKERASQNFDHPTALDFPLFIEHVKLIRNGVDVEKPIYDFLHHTRMMETSHVTAQPVVILEGILLYENPFIRDLIDIKLYVETPSDYRFIRRMMRDIKERGRSTESVVQQYYKTVRPMHIAFVEPTREYADIIIPWQGYNEVAIDMVISKIEGKLEKLDRKDDFINVTGDARPKKHKSKKTEQAIDEPSPIIDAR